MSSGPDDLPTAPPTAPPVAVAAPLQAPVLDVGEPRPPWWRRPSAVALRIGGLAALAAAGYLAWLGLGSPDRTALVEYGNGHGAAGPLVSVLAVALLVCVLVPRTALAIIAGLVFGPVLGAGYVLAGLALGGVASFLLGRWLGRDVVARLDRRWLNRIDRAVARRRTGGVALVRLLPVPPFGVASLLLGATRVRTRHYLLGTLVGAAPNTIGYAAAGGAAVSTGLAAVLSGLIGCASIGVSMYLVRAERRRFAQADPTGGQPPSPVDG